MTRRRQVFAIQEGNKQYGDQPAVLEPWEIARRKALGTLTEASVAPGSPTPAQDGEPLSRGHCPYCKVYLGRRKHLWMKHKGCSAEKHCGEVPPP